MSFKYRFILSFVLLEVFFIVLIVSVNFFTISNSSKKLTFEKIESNTIFMEELLKVPVSIYDLATLDDLVNNASKYMNSVVVLESSGKILSKIYNFEEEPLKKFLTYQKDRSISLDDKSYEVIYKKIYAEDIFIGSFYLVFDTSKNLEFIKTNRNRTLLIIFLEILVSTYLSYLIGRNLTQKLTNLSETAKGIGKDNLTEVPYLNSKDEIGVLANSLNKMQTNLLQRSKDLKEFNKLLLSQKKQLIEANKYKDDFLANMSHELKTPLNSINVISDVMMKNRTKNLTDKQVKNLKIVNNCGKDLLYLINDILDLSKLEAGQINIEKSDIDVKEMAQDVFDMFESQAKSKGITLELEVDDNIGMIFSDEDRVKQILKNLISNALKFTSEGTVRFKVKNSNHEIKVFIEDEGIGIPEDKLEHIFNRFKQADGSTTRQYGGTGLGLAISKELAKLLDGNIKVKSIVGEGSTFELTLPKNVANLNENLTLKTIEKTNKLEFIVFNNEPVSFISIITELKKSFKVSQTHTLDLLFKLYEKTNNKVLIDLDTLKKDELEKIKQNILKEDLIAVCKEDIEDLNNHYAQIIKKPFSARNIKTI